MAARFVPAFFALAVIAVWPLLADAAVQTIALRGDHAISPGEDATFSSFALPSLNNRGQVAFAATLTGSAVTTGNDTGYWIAGNGSVGTILREGGTAPGMAAGAVFGNIFSLSTALVPINDAGDIAVGMFATQSSGVWIGNGQSLTLLAAQGSAAPGAENSAPFGTLADARVTLNPKGDVAFYANLNAAPYTTINSTNYSDGLWVLNRSGLVTSVLAGRSAPEIGPQAQLFGFRTFTQPPLNRNGEVAVDASYRIAPAASAIVPSMWLASAGGVELRGYYGQPLPDLGPNAKLSSTTPSGVSSNGAIAARVSITGGATYSGIAVSDAAATHFPVYLGAPAPGTGGRVFQEAFYEPTISSGGDIAFFGYAFFTGTSDYKTGVWAGPADDLQLVALQGMAAPGTNATFGSFIRDTPAINRFGQVATPATLVEGSVNSNSLWATDIDGNLAMIGRVGGTLEVSPGDVRTISSLSMLTKHGDDDGKPRGLNDLGQIAFGASFSDGTSGIFVSNAVAHLPGDYNHDHIVDTADYIVWRKAMTTQNLVADGDRDGVVGAEDYELWREFSGQSLVLPGSGVGSTSVPEPGAALRLMMLSLLYLRRWRGTA